MADFDNTNRGMAMVNDKKTEDKHPDWNGSLNVEGTDYWLSIWKKTSKAGKPYMSISIRQKQEQTRQSSQPTRKAPPAKDLPDDDIPW
jgi:uncharacterized protein (DUF736 family)